jgi:membrane protein DedA with SNARE-associated domain
VLGFGVAAAIGLLFLTESGVPVLVPADLLMLLVGERASAGDVSLAVAVSALEVVALVGSAALFLFARGPGRLVVTRLGARVGLTNARIGRLRARLQDRGGLALLIGRATPGLRTVTVLAASSSGLSLRRALLPLFLGSSLFLQAHLALGYAFGESARGALKAVGPAVLVLVVLAAAVMLVLWLRRRRGGAAAQAWGEAACPACLGLSLVPGVGVLASPAER